MVVVEEAAGQRYRVINGREALAGDEGDPVLLLRVRDVAEHGRWAPAQVLSSAVREVRAALAQSACRSPLEASSVHGMLYARAHCTRPPHAVRQQPAFTPSWHVRRLA